VGSVSGIYFLRLDGHTGTHTATTLIDDPRARWPAAVLRHHGGFRAAARAVVGQPVGAGVFTAAWRQSTSRAGRTGT